MNDLRLSFSNGKIVGSGVDIVGEFEMRGQLKEAHIYLNKRYIGQHEIAYHGVSAGEGAYSGHWSIGGYSGGEWFIGIRRAEETDVSTEIEVQQFD